MRKVAIIRRNGLGDLILSFPLLFSIKKNSPSTEITLFLDQRNAPLLPYLPKIFDKSVIFPKGNKYLTLLFTALKYRKEKFDMAISAKTSPMKIINLFLFLLGAKRRVAYVEKKKWTSKLVNEPHWFDKKKNLETHQALQGLQLVQKQESVPPEFYPKIVVPKKIKEHYPLHLTNPAPYLILSASTNGFSNRIDEQKYASLVNRLGQTFSFSVVLLGEKKDEKRAQAIKERLIVPQELYFPRNFDHFMVLLDKGDMFFTPDGGIGHIGAGLGKKMVVLFGSEEPKQWRPLSKEAKILYHEKHVNEINDEEIYQALYNNCEEVNCGRVHT